MSKKLAKNKGGRPLSIDESVVSKLESILKIGGTIEEACANAGISKPTYYRQLERDEGFVTKMESAKHFADIAAKNVVVRDIIENEDVGTSKWWLEKRQFNNQNTTNVQVNIANVIQKQVEEYQLDE